MFVPILAFIGILLSFYAIVVKERSKEQGYKPLCDISERISCTKAFTSDYGKLLWFYNASVGLFFYFLVLMAALSGSIVGLRILALIGFFGTILLAWLSYVRMRNFCLVCTVIYLVNIAILFLVF